VDIVVGCVAILLAAVIGFAVHRASLCNVKAVAELLTSKRAHMLGSFLKTMLWVIAVTFVIEFFFHPVSARPLQVWGFSALALVGGFVFGVGAAVNGGCALGTLGRLGSGELRMLFTLLGLVAGLAGGGYAQMRQWLPAPERVDFGLSIRPILAIVVTAILFLWTLWELWRLWRKRDSNATWWKRVLSARYRLSTAALLLGVANGVLFVLFGSWAYTRTARTAVNHVVMGRPGPALLYWLLFAALLGGVLLSSLTNKRFALDLRFRLDWLLNLFGGFLMGVGATLAPGGNDVLILHTIPGGSPHALPTYGALLVGTAAGLIVIRTLGGTAVRIECTGDICRTRPVPKI
jgi:uncharacterized membrane protein YedE/YeeE